MGRDTFSDFAATIVNHKYAHDLKTRPGKEDWTRISRRVPTNVFGAVDAPSDLIEKAVYFLRTRKWIPGGRYLYASGRPYHQVNNCGSGDTRVVTRAGVKPLSELAGGTHTIMTTGGSWVDAPFRSFGEQSLMEVVLSRGKATKRLHFTPDHSWRVAVLKNDGSGNRVKKDVLTKDLKPGDQLWQVFGHGISRLNASSDGIRHGIVYGDGTRHGRTTDRHGFQPSWVRLCGEKDQVLEKWFLGYRKTEDGSFRGLPRHYKDLPSLDYDRSYLLGWLEGYFAADGCVDENGKAVICSTNRKSIERVREVCYLLGIGSGPIGHQDRISNLTGRESRIYKTTLFRCHLTPEFFLLDEHRRRFQENPPKRKPEGWKVVSVEDTGRVEEVFCATVPKTHEFVLEDNILTGNCFLFRAEDSREGWSDLMYKATMSLMSGGGIGVVYSGVREEGRKIRKTGGYATGPLALMQMVNESGRFIMQGGSRRSAIWSGLHWDHPDSHKFAHVKDWSPEVRSLKEKDFNFPAPLDMTNISLILDDGFFKAYDDDKNPKHALAHSVYGDVVRQMLKTGEPGFSVDVGENSGENLRNACTEITSRDDSDVCNLGSINMARIDSLDEMREVVEVATAFHLAGTVYSLVPFPAVDRARDKNRRIGLGLMGLHEWLLARGKKYGPDDELDEYLQIYESVSDEAAEKYANMWDLSVPVKKRAIAPTGTIGIVAETTTGIEPMICAAFKRRYLDGQKWRYQYVIETVAKRLVEEHGIDPNSIEDAYTLAADPERRLAFQAHVQKYVDHGISSTLNLPAWGTELNNDQTVQEFGRLFLKYLPQIRGLTCYPDGARGGQPLTPVKYATAMKHLGEVFEESLDICEITGRGGTCGG